MSTRDWITVGIDETEGARAATRWAAHEAVRRGLGLRIVHVYNDLIPMGRFYAAAYPAAPIEGRPHAERLVKHASAEASEIISENYIQTRVLRGDRRDGLLQVAARSRMLVMGDQRRPFVDRLFTGSILLAVAAHSPVPVVLVPAGWEADPDDGAVVAGVKAPDSGRELVRHALQLATDRRAPLVLVHAWEYPSGYDDLIANHVDVVEWEERARKELTQLVEELGGAEGVDVEIRVVHGQPARVLTEASKSAALVVLARRRHGFPFGHLGGTGRAVVRETRSPLVVLPATTEVQEVAS
jgi:nucleotide-binding universal stress UspA family protein